MEDIKKEFREFLKKERIQEQKEVKEADEKGIYIGVKYADSSNEELMDFIKKYNIPSTLKPEDFHTTLIYSRKYAEIDSLEDDFINEIIAYPKGLEVFETFDKKRALVIKLDCKYLEDKHKYLMDKYDLTYDYPEYVTHITVSYDIGNMEIPEDVELPESFRVVSSYQEVLNTKKKYK